MNQLVGKHDTFWLVSLFKWLISMVEENNSLIPWSFLNFIELHNAVFFVFYGSLVIATVCLNFDFFFTEFREENAIKTIVIVGYIHLCYNLDFFSKNWEEKCKFSLFPVLETKKQLRDKLRKKTCLFSFVENKNRIVRGKKSELCVYTSPSCLYHAILTQNYSDIFLRKWAFIVFSI